MNNVPLAERMRPVTIDDIIGQEEILGKGKPLYRAILADMLTSIILYGPPGTGKTSLARVIANTTKANFRQINATTAGKKDMESVITQAKENTKNNKKTILFIDEIHRFNKSQQDYLLPYVEDGTITLIGATTENPYFEVNSALLSRSKIFQLYPLSKENILEIMRRTIKEDRGIKKYGATIDKEAAEFLSDIADGDARFVLNTIELAVLSTERSEDGKIHIDLETTQQCVQKRQLKYDKNGDNHYDTVAAFIQSMNGSDPDAALYYLARMLEAGEDVKFITRRMMILASEDIGNADPMALCVATSAALAVERVGLPEGRIILANAVTYLACAPKSNAAITGIEKALSVVRETGNLPIPVHMQDRESKNSAKLGKGVGYLYPHDFPNHFVGQQCLPDKIKNVKIWSPSNMGKEKEMKERIEWLRKSVNSST